ncbi:hypothetical protein AC578_4356 [Pseudocercospora eumusae]|uniref:Uncharacterized protein n=1 Tax=Pseudocercospora eumusae TaxID=321146 RepID=A0A139H5X9_9PEZI|nr:hypothetical protein AC578_4356 [Pseudocercospora eumusae]
MARLRTDLTATTKPTSIAPRIVRAIRDQSGALPLFRQHWWDKARDTFRKQSEEGRKQEDEQSGSDSEEENDECAARKPPTPTASTLISIHAKVIATLPEDVIESLTDAFAATLSYQNRKAARSLARSTFWDWDLLAVFAIFGAEACTRRFLDTVKELSGVWDTRDAAWAALLEASTLRKRDARNGTRAQSVEWMVQDATLAKRNGAARSKSPTTTSTSSENADEDGDDERRDVNADEDGDEERENADEGDNHNDNDEGNETRQQDEGDGSEEEIEGGRGKEQEGQDDDDDSEHDMTFGTSFMFMNDSLDDDGAFMPVEDMEGGLGNGDDAASRSLPLPAGEFPAADFPFRLGSDSNHEPIRNNTTTQQRLPTDIHSDLTNRDMSKRSASAASHTGGPSQQRRRMATTTLFPNVPVLDVSRVQLDHGAQLERWLALFRDTTTFTLPRLPVEDSDPFWDSITPPARYCILVPSPSPDASAAQPETAHTRLAAVALVTLRRDAAAAAAPNNPTRSRVRAFVATDAETPDHNELLRGVTDFARKASTRADSNSSISNEVQDDEEDGLITMMDNLPRIAPDAYSSALVAMATFYCAGHAPRDLTQACLDPTLWALMLRFAEDDHDAADSLTLPSAYAFCQTSSESFIPEPSAWRQTDYLATMQQGRARVRHICSTLGLALSRIGNLYSTCAAILSSLSQHLETTSAGAQPGAAEISEDDLAADIATAEQVIDHLQQRITDDHARPNQRSVQASRRALEAQQGILSNKQQQLELLRSRQAQNQRLQRCKDMLTRLLGHLALRQYEYAGEKKHLEKGLE